jgi:hypothetical protein
MSVADEIPSLEVVDGVDLSISDVLGFCACGRPEDAHRFILEGLRYVDRPYDKERWRERFDAEEARFGSSGAMYFFWYWLDAEGLTEHGGGVPGWLTERGKDLLALLEAAAERSERC